LCAGYKEAKEAVGAEGLGPADQDDDGRLDLFGEVEEARAVPESRDTAWQLC
jgi:hypothetical protein